MAIALWRLLARADLDVEDAAPPRRPWLRTAAQVLVDPAATDVPDA